MKKITLSLFALLFVAFSTAFAQKEDDESIEITIDDIDVNLEAFFDELGNSIEAALSDLSDGDTHISITINEREIESSMEKFGEAMEKLGEGIEEAVKNMTIEIKNIDADDIRDGDGKINGKKIRNILEEIEDEYGQEVETVDRMQMKFREDRIYLEMDVTLENGKEIRNIKKTIKD